MSLAEREGRLKEEYKTSENVSSRIDLYQRFGTNRYGWQRWAFDRLEVPAPATILELGCGPGTLWLKNADRIPSGWNVTLSDFSEGMLGDARANLRGCGHPFTFQVFNIESIPFPDAHFDVVMANFMLYHVSDVPRALAEVHRVLRPGGRFFSATVGLTHLQEVREMVRRFAEMTPRPDFLLEDGEAALARRFAKVELHPFENELVVGEAGPLVDYVMSTKTLAWHDDKGPQEFRRFVEDEVARSGTLHVTVEAGLFEATKSA